MKSLLHEIIYALIFILLALLFILAAHLDNTPVSLILQGVISLAMIGMLIWLWRLLRKENEK